MTARSSLRSTDKSSGARPIRPRRVSVLTSGPRVAALATSGSARWLRARCCSRTGVSGHSCLCLLTDGSRGLVGCRHREAPVTGNARVRGL